MWSTKLLYSIWRWTQKYATPHETNKPYELKWTNINVYDVSAMLKYVTVSFHSMNTNRLYLLWMQFPQTFYVWILMWKNIFSPEIFVRHKCLLFLCVCTCTNLLVLNTEVKQGKSEGIWKLRPAYSPETPNLGKNRWCFVPCDLEIWWMTLENNRASLLCCFKLCATFHSHRWIQTGVTVRKRPIWVKFDDF